MKKNASYKNIFDVLLGVYFVSWMFFEVIITGNKFDIFAYSGFSGKLIVLFGQITPAVAIYMFMTVWKDVSSLRDFIFQVFKFNDLIMFTTWTITFCLFHIVVVTYSGDNAGYRMTFLIILIPFCVMASGLDEICWRGFIFPALWERFPYFIAAIITGFLHGFYYLPLWSVAGSNQSKHEFSVYLLYCVFLSVLLSALYRLTESVFSCIAFRTLCQVMVVLYRGLIFERARVTSMFILEMVLATVMACWLGGKIKKADTMDMV